MRKQFGDNGLLKALDQQGSFVWYVGAKLRALAGIQNQDELEDCFSTIEADCLYLLFLIQSFAVDYLQSEADRNKMQRVLGHIYSEYIREQTIDGTPNNKNLVLTHCGWLDGSVR